MRIHVRAESVLRAAVVLLALGGTLPALAGVHLERFGFQKLVAPPGTNTNYLDDFDAGGALVNPTGAFDWGMRIGTVPEEDSGLRFRPWSQGAAFSIGSYATRSQVMELQTAGAGTIDSAPSNFVVFAVYELDTFRRAEVFAGVGLTDVFRGAGTRAIANTLGREGDRYYGKFSNALTGEIIDKDWLEIPLDTKYVEAFIGRDRPDNDFVIGGYGFRDASLGLLGVQRYSGSIQAFSDVVLSPVVFVGTLVPEPQTWVLMIAGSAAIAWRIRAATR
jgi:hypothetical protein